jgi:DNA-binding transcriptional MerR regulator
LDKAPDAFRTISEVADDLDIPQHVLRFWESRFSQIKPMKRGGGRRYYRPDDVALLRGIRHLLYGQGYTIRGVQRILREQGIRFVQTVWEEGAEQPAMSDEDEGAAVERVEDEDIEAEAGPAPVAAPSERREPVFAEAPDQGIQRRAPVAPMPPMRHEPEDTAATVDRQALHAVLDELAECRRLLDAALQEPA